MTMGNRLRRGTALLIVVVAAASACGKTSDAPVADTLDSIDTVKALEPAADSTLPDSTATLQQSPPASSSPRGKLPPPGGETYKQGGALAPRDPLPPNDPPPKIIGETRRDGSTLSPSYPRPRDSVTGPRLEIDSRGNVTPIKR